jgi:hypothetical protein
VEWLFGCLVISMSLGRNWLGRTVALVAMVGAGAVAQDRAHLGLQSEFGSYVEAGVPFFTQTVDARKFGTEAKPDNLTPRGIVVPAGNGVFGCFDPDLLRWALVWKQTEGGEYLTMDGMASGSYRLPNRKAAAGQKELPRPLGEPLLAMPLLPGVGSDGVPMTDPRERGNAEVGELGLGPVPPAIGRFSGIRREGSTARLEYEVSGVPVVERLVSEGAGVARLIEVGVRKGPLRLRTGAGPDEWLRLEASSRPSFHRVSISVNGSVHVAGCAPFGERVSAVRRWSEVVIPGAVQISTRSAAWVFDDIPLPIPNPWRRNVRPVDLEFLDEARAAVLTFDGDLWIVAGLGSDQASWRRFASGFNEPQSLCIQRGAIHVFDRNGIIRVTDSDGDGEADWYENFSNIVAQSAETRNYPMDLIAANDGGFYVALGGQIGSTIGRNNGVVAKVSADGASYRIVASGFRQPYLGYDADTGTLTASDQQGNWKPATPVYRVEDGSYYGFQPEKFGANARHPAPIAPPEVWIPHFVNQSGASQVWLKRREGGRVEMAGLNGALIHIGYGRPEIFSVLLDHERQQGVIVPVLGGFPSGLLNGRVHPRDGKLYLAGFQIFGSTGSRVGGIYRVRPGGVSDVLPREVVAERRGILMRFDVELPKDVACDVGRYSIDRWNYRQTHQYGSGNYRTDRDEAGQEALDVSSVTLSQDGRSLFIGIPGMGISHSLRLTYRAPVAGVDRVENVYLTVRGLSELDLRRRGFISNEVDLTLRDGAKLSGKAVEPSAALGREVALRVGCVGCHGIGDPTLAVAAGPSGGAKTAMGPSWIGLWGAKRVFTDGTELRSVDAAYLRESILDPARRVQLGYDMERTGVGMPSYLGVLKEHEIESLVLFIQTLRK